MRVLDTHTGQFVDKDPADIEYAILSHTWDNEGEQTYKQLKKIQKRYHPESQPQHGPPSSLPNPSSIPSGDCVAPSPVSTPDVSPAGQSEAPLSPIWQDLDLSPKIRDACAIARANGHRYIWIDSCCFDKSSSSELSEAINSMYAWYATAKVCYAYLADVPTRENHRRVLSPFRRSRWFTRGWTLQELIAPLEVVFLSSDWAVIGRKNVLADLLEEITGIGIEALIHVESLDRFSVAQRLSWAARRETTRVEDQAYSLLGIFDIHMPTLYGEGDRAFRRLQEEIMRRIPDQSLFAWGKLHRGSQTLQVLRPSSSTLRPRRQKSQQSESASCHAATLSALAPTPSAFVDCGRISATHAASHTVIHGVQLEYTSSPYGIRTQFQVIPLSQFFPLRPMDPEKRSQLKGDMKPWDWYLAILGCEHREHPGHLLGRVCYVTASDTDVECLFPGYIHLPSGSKVHLFPLSPDTLEHCRRAKSIELKTVYISHLARPPSTAGRTAQCADGPHRAINLLLPTRARDALRAQGYIVEFRHPESQGPDETDTHTHQLMLSHDDHSITIEYQHTLQSDGRRFTINALVGVSRPFLPGSTLKKQEQEAFFSRTVSWSDSFPWWSRLGVHSVTFDRKGAETLTVSLDLELIAGDIYLLDVEVQ